MTDDFERGGSDYGSDIARDLGDQATPAYRDAPPDILGPIDESSPVSGHVPVWDEPGPVASMAPENDWNAAASVIVPLLRPAGTTGIRLRDADQATLVANANQAHTLPLLDDGPCDLMVAYALPASGFDVIVNGEHLLSWGVEPRAVNDAALANLASWSAGAAWSSETSGERRLLSSDTGAGWDAARILLADARAHLASELGGSGARVLVGLPDRHLLLAGSLRADDSEFAVLFRSFVVDHSEGADEPIDQRVFELTDGELVEFAG